jgi:glyoxylase-like metal-dependent hydrolase (beta-lactamase superfamily II)
VRRLVAITDRILVGTSELYTTTTTVIIGSRGGCLVVDPAVTPADIAELAADLRRLELRVVAGFSTHPHWDHVLWSAGLGVAPRYATADAVRAIAADFERSWRLAEEFAPGNDAGLFGRLTALSAGTESIPWDGPEARLIEHRAHAPGHAALFLPSEGVLLTGDMCSDIEIPLLDTKASDAVADYRRALDLFASVDGVRHVIPGHGHVGDGAELQRRITADRQYLDALESGGGGDDPRLIEDWLVEAHRAHLFHTQLDPGRLSTD